MGIRRTGTSRWRGPRMARILILLVGVHLLGTGASAQRLPAPRADTVPATSGSVAITPIGHASVQIVYDGFVIHVDPWRPGYYADAERADLILVTDIPGDHLDPDAIAAIRKPDTPVIVPPSAADSLPIRTVLANGESTTVRGVGIEAVPSYDLTPGEPYHPPGRGNGYLVTLGDVRLYFSGGGLECVPEIRALTDIDVAFIAMNLPNERMTPLAAADCVKAFAPRIVYPYHYRDADLAVFLDALRGTPVEVRLANWYPEGTSG